MLCPAGTYLSSDQICKEFSQTLQDTLTNSQLLNSAATQATNLISKGRAISLSAAISGKIFSQIKYLNISYSGELEVALLTWLTSFVSLGLTPNMPESMIEEIPNRHVPYVFEKYDIPSSFLENFWENLGVIIFFTALWLLLKGAEHLISPKKKPRIASLTRRVRVMVQNFLITVLYGVYGDLIMFSIIEYRTLVFGWNLSLISFIISVILLLIMFVSFWHQTKLLITYQKFKKQDQSAPNNSPKLLEEFTKKHEGSQVLFKDFKDYSLAPQLFIFFLTARDLLFSLTLTTMFEYPLPETIILAILDCLMIAYLILKRPFNSSFDFSQQMFFEMISLMVSVAVLTNAVLDAGKYKAVGTRNNIGKLIIVANMIFNFVTGLFMLVTIIQIVKEFVQEIKERQAKKIKALSIKNRLQELPLNETENTPQITLNKNLDSSQIFLKGNDLLNNTQSFETTSHENSDLNLLPHQIQPHHLLTESHQRHPLKIKTTASNSHLRHVDQNNRFGDTSISPTTHHLQQYPLQNPRSSKSRSLIKGTYNRSQERQERNPPEVDLFQGSEVHHTSDRPCIKGTHRLRMNQRGSQQVRKRNFPLNNNFKFDEET